MVQYERHKLSNGLTVLLQPDPNTELAIVNTLYDVGARDESPEHTGLAHLFEHLMFEGSANIPHFDKPLQEAGGDSNAWTNNDITNYYDVLPAYNLETALWLESDRMNQLSFDQHGLDTQINVVCEEFKENYINVPYGDVWHNICSLSYKKHPYQWPTIGKELGHVQKTKMDDIKRFFYRYYRPNNAVLVVAGKIDVEKTLHLIEKWFGDIEGGEQVDRNYLSEPEQTEKRHRELRGDVPANVVYKAFHTEKRLHSSFYAADLISDVLTGSESSRLFLKLVQDQQLFTEVSSYTTGFRDRGLLIFEGKVAPGVDVQKADEALRSELDLVIEKGVGERELKKVQNKQSAYLLFSEENLGNRASELAFFELEGDASAINSEVDRYEGVSPSEIQNIAAEILPTHKENSIHYLSKS